MAFRPVEPQSQSAHATTRDRAGVAELDSGWLMPGNSIGARDRLRAAFRPLSTIGACRYPPQAPRRAPL